jgi:hypothetical protein
MVLLIWLLSAVSNDFCSSAVEIGPVSRHQRVDEWFCEYGENTAVFSRFITPQLGFVAQYYVPHMKAYAEREWQVQPP